MRKPSRCTHHLRKISTEKSLCQFWHAKKRAKERLGIDYTDELNAQIISCIRNNQKYHKDFSIEYIENQSNRLKVYNLNIKAKNINLVYDSFRNQVITFLFQEDSINIYHYYDIFRNKISTKHNFGKIWKLKDTNLDIPGETVIYDNGIWSVTDGVLQGKQFKLENNEIIEII